MSQTQERERVPDERGAAVDGRVDVGVREARRRFGGIDVPATLLGTLSAIALLVLLSGLAAAAIGAVGYQLGVEGNETGLSVAGLVGGLVVIFLAFLAGGWGAGRMARYDGARNGLMTGVWLVVLAAALAALGAWLGSEYDVFANVSLPQWFSRDAATTGGIVTALLAIAVTLVGGALGGNWGERFHRDADRAIAWTRPGGIERPGLGSERP